MENPRPEKVAVVTEVRERLSNSQAALLTEYRGINVTEMSNLRRALRAAGGDYKVYKNTLVRFAARDLGLEIDQWLTGPTAIAFVPSEGGGDPVTVAKALRDFAKANQNLIVKGGIMGGSLLSADDARALADVAPREVLLAQFAGALQAPMQQFASLLQALPRNFAYGLKALIEDKGGVPEAPPAPEVDEPKPAEATESSTDAVVDAEPEAEAATEAETPAEPEVATETEAPAEPEAATETEAPAEPEAATETETPAEPEAATETEAAPAETNQSEAAAEPEAAPETSTEEN